MQKCYFILCSVLSKLGNLVMVEFCSKETIKCKISSYSRDNPGHQQESKGKLKPNQHPLHMGLLTVDN